MRGLATMALLACTSSAAAEPVGLASETPRREPAAVEPARIPAPVADPGPDPDQASGVSVEDEPATSRARWIPRALLFVPKIVLWGALQPARGVAYLVERDGAGSQRLHGTFEEGHTLGAYPVASYESELGGVIGARVMLKNILGKGERLQLRADGGTAITYGLGARITTGERFSPVRISLGADLERHPHDLFFGIGNGDGAGSRFRQDLVRTAATAEVAVTDAIELAASSGWTRHELDDRHLTSAYVAGEAAYDTRRPSSLYPTQTIDATGWLVRARARAVRGTGTDPTRYVGYGGELERDLDLHGGTRTLALRILVDAVAGSEDRIPFVDLPMLGGPDYLRGYPSGRFRDRAVVVSTAEYAWRLFNQASAYTFVDAGKPVAALGRVDEGPIRIGYGAGLLLHTKHTHFVRAQLAASRDGDVLVSLAFQPTSGRRERARRP